MDRGWINGLIGLWLVGAAVVLSGCTTGGGPSGPGNANSGVNANANTGGGNANANASANGNTNSSAPMARDKFALWNNGTQLRGANIFQRRVYPDLDGPEFLGPGPLGPPYTQADFDRLAELGANYVNISHTGLFTQMPPYQVDADVQANLDGLLDMIAQADMFAVISFRSGPGRGEFALIPIPGLARQLSEQSVWQDQAAQDGWAAMWRYTAKRYRDNPAVAGYDLMVEPNAPQALLDIFDPAQFYMTYADTLYDWNQLHPRITAAIREVDGQTPILVGAGGYSAVGWLPFVRPTGDARTVYAFHQYDPFIYSAQDPPMLTLRYPGMYDADEDGTIDRVDRDWLANLLNTATTYSNSTGAPVAANEFGAKRWVPDAAAYVGDQMDLLEGIGINYAVWLWSAAHPPAAADDDFNFRHGPDPANHADVDNDLLSVIRDHLGRNTVRPSN